MKPRKRNPHLRPRSIRWHFERPVAAPYTPRLSPVADMWTLIMLEGQRHAMATIPLFQPVTLATVQRIIAK